MPSSFQYTRRPSTTEARRKNHRQATRVLVGIVTVALLSATGCSSMPKRMEDDESFDKAPYGLHRDIGIALLNANQPAQALPHFRRLERMRPESSEPYYLLARVYTSLKLHELAEPALEQAIAVDPEYAAAHAALGILLDAAGRHECAGEAHARAIELDSRQAAYHNNMGFNSFLRERHEQALAAYQRALALEPHSRRIHNNLGFVYGALGDLERAKRHFHKGGTAALAKNNLGLVHETRGNLGAAHRLYLEATMNDPSLSQARSNLVRVCEALGRPVPAFPTEGEEQ